MTIKCLLGARFNMTAELLSYDTTYTPDSTDVGDGTWAINQDPITGEIINTWIPGVEDDPVTTGVDESVAHITFPCFVRGIYNVATRGGIGEEQFGAEYENMERLNMWVPGGVRITKRDRVTNISSHGSIVFLDEEFNDRATVYNVSRVTPRFDPWNRVQDQLVLLEKVQ